MTQVKKIFADYFKIHRPYCIYSGQQITGSISHDHFMPWSFLGDDPIYNFVPTTKEINSKKSNILPAKSYLPIVAKFQYRLFDFVRSKSRSTVLESYLTNLKVTELAGLDEFESRFKDFYNPLYLTAKNQGFQTNWKLI